MDSEFDTSFNRPQFKATVMRAMPWTNRKRLAPGKNVHNYHVL